MTVAIVIAALLAAIAIGRLWSTARASQPDNDAASVPADDASADWRAEVELEQISEADSHYERNRLTIVLRNSKGREIETPNTSFEANGTPLKYFVSQGNFYDRHPYYVSDEDAGVIFAADTTCEITIRRTNDSALPFARLRTPAPMLPANFKVPAQHPNSSDLVIQWAGLRQQAELLVYKTHTLDDEQGNQTVAAGGPYADDAIRQLIGTDEQTLREGRYVIPARYFAASAAGRVSTLTIEINTTTSGQFLHPVLKPSMITARRKILFRVEVVAAP